MRFLREFGTGPDPAKRSRLQPERIGARGPNDPYTLSPRLPLSPSIALIRQPAPRFTAIRFLPPLRAFVLSYCRRFCFLPRVNLLYLQPTTSSSPSLPWLSSARAFARQYLPPLRYERVYLYKQVRADTGVTQTRMQWNT